MSNMRGGNKYSGYTIIEVLIVLAISSFMFVIASQFISGKAADTSFRTGVNEMASRIQDAIDQVSNGQYTDKRVTCTVDQNSGTYTITEGGGGSQGSNEECLFIGKIVEFTTDTKTYKVYTLAGRSYNAGNPATSYSLAEPQIVALFTVTKSMPQGLTPTSRYVFGVGQSLGSYSSGNFSSGSQSTKLIKPSNASLPPTPPTITGLDGVVTTFSMCITDGTRSGQISVGDNNSMSVSTKIFYNSSCA